MYDYSKQIKSFHEEKVRLPGPMREKLTDHRGANEDRLISRLPDLRKGLKISKSRFRSQGSFAMRTIIQTRFEEEEYDIDDGVLLHKADLADEDGEMSADDAANLVLSALKDERFAKQPVRKHNCVRVFYADEDEYKHHVDFPVYRTSTDDDGVETKELASRDGWVESDPTQVNTWFEDLIKQRESARSGSGTQLRQIVRLLKRFCRSRKTWDMPNGLKLTMLVAELATYSDRIDVAFENLLRALQGRLAATLEVENLADDSYPKAKLTRTASDPNMVELRDRVAEAIEELSVLFDGDCTKIAARAAWDWVFKSDGYFESLDDDGGDDDDGGGGRGVGTFGIATSTPTEPVDHQGGGRFG